MAKFFNFLHGLEVKLLTIMLKVPSLNPSEDKTYLLLEKLVIFSKFLEKSIFNTKNCHFSNTWGEICTNSEMEPFEITNFDLGHPVAKLTWMKIVNITITKVVLTKILLGSTWSSLIISTSENPTAPRRPPYAMMNCSCKLIFLTR